jgi:hypothetical protein
VSRIQRAVWNGTPDRLSDAFTLTKTKDDSTLRGVCEVWTHQFGWELRLTVDGHGLLVSSVVRSAEDLREKIETWRSAMVERAGADAAVLAGRGSCFPSG